MPIVDYHCHINPQEIFEDKQYPNIAQLWLGVGGSGFGDHYKWRFMRACGVEEAYITGNAPDEERFVRWAQCLEKAIGNPLYHWSHLELQRYFQITQPLKGDNAREIYRQCNEKLKDPSLSVRGIIRQSGVRLICTTDDPVDSLQWHDKIAADESFDVKVLPAWRPDRALDLRRADYTDYIGNLSRVSGVRIECFEDLKAALRIRMDYFSKRGCVVSDHGLDYVMYAPASKEETDAIFRRRLAGQMPDAEEARKFICAFMLYMGKEYHDRDWVMQMHFGCSRNNNGRALRTVGPDSGYDSIAGQIPANELIAYLNALEEEDRLPKTILYSLNPNDNALIDTIIGCFQDGTAPSRLQHGAAWWFNDHMAGMTEQMESVAGIGSLAGFVGMLTDSRSFLSYTRHEYFRRLLCRMFGQWVEEGMYPADMEALGQIVKDISYNNAVRYFGFPLEEA